MTMTRDFQIFPIDKLRGVEESSYSILNYWALDKRSYNITMGLNDGYSPRFGMQPIQGHAASVYNTHNGVFYLGGLRFSESLDPDTFEQQWSPRVKVYACYPIELEESCYTWVTLRNHNQAQAGGIITGGYCFDISISQKRGWAGAPAPYFSSGFKETILPTNNVIFPISRIITAQDESCPLVINESNIRNYYITDVYTSPQIRSQLEYQFGTPVTAGSSPTAVPNVEIISYNEFSDSWSLDTINEKRSIQIQMIGPVADFPGLGTISWNKYDSVVLQNISATGSNYIRGRPGATSGTNTGSVTMTMSSVGTQEVRDPAAYGANTNACTFIMIQDPSNNISSAFSLAMIAKKNPLGIFYRPWRFYSVPNSAFPEVRTRTYGSYVSFIKPINFFISSRATVSNETGSPPYTEDGLAKYTVWNRWHNWAQNAQLPPDCAVDATTGQNDDGVSNVTLGPTGSGILRANTTYEITYSVFDKVLNKETNVGVPAKIQTGDDDSVALTIYRQSYDVAGAGASGYSRTTQYEDIISSDTEANVNSVIANDNFANEPVIRCKNSLQYRFYYRPLGAFEWRFAGAYDYAQFFLDGVSKRFYICQADAVGLPGGQPGSIYDHSDLPDEDWFDVKVFQNSLCWLSAKTFAFSAINNPFDYPLRNRAPVPRGTYKGMIVHKYPGQSEQGSRLVIFGTEGTYVFRYKGQSFLSTYNLQLNDTQTVTIPLEQSDARLDFWYSATSFTGRSAIVAEGILYWWGAKGIFADDGVNNPTNISQAMNINQYISTIYEKGTQDEIFTSYDKNTNEITWYFRPNLIAEFGFTASSSTRTLGLVINIKFNTFVGIFKYANNMNLDWAQPINIENDVTTNIGERTIVGYHNSALTGQPQRAFFHDAECITPDYSASGNPLMFSQVVENSTTEYRLISPSGSPTVVTGQQILIKDFKDYTNSVLTVTGSPDAFYTVIGVTGPDVVGNTRITITGAPGGFPTAAYDSMNYFPGYTSGQGFDFNLQNRFFSPGGLAAWFSWQYNLTNYRVELLEGNTQQLNYRFLSLLREDTSDNDRVIDMVDNLNGNFQVHHAIEFQNALAQGQALAFKMFGVYYGGHKWTLQYHHFEATPDDYGNIRQFEG